MHYGLSISDESFRYIRKKFTWELCAEKQAAIGCFSKLILFLKKEDSPGHRALLLIMRAGLKKGEILKLRREQIFTQNGTLYHKINDNDFFCAFS